MNSIIQCLVATPVLEDFLLDYSFSEKKEPIGFGLSSMAKALLRNERPAPHQFKKMIDVHLPLFSGYDQHDAQEFLNVLLDKLNDEIAQKPTVVDYLFGGKITSHLSCNSCSALKNIEEKMYILSLPIPEPEFNYFSIVVVPVTSRSLRKLIFRLPRDALVVRLPPRRPTTVPHSRSDPACPERTSSSWRRVSVR
jgi:ubiquitin C-terminal hydrolase